MTADQTREVLVRLYDALARRDGESLARWASQALGLPGLLFGRFAWFQGQVRKKATRQLGLPARV